MNNVDVQNVGIAGDCSEAAFAPNVDRPSRRTEAVKHLTHRKNEQFSLHIFNRRRKIFVQINTKRNTNNLAVKCCNV